MRLLDEHFDCDPVTPMGTNRGMGDGGHASAELVTMFLQHQRNRSLSERTVERRRTSLESFLRWIHPMPLSAVDLATVEEWLGTLRAARTKHAYRSDLHVFFAWAVKRRLLATNPAADTDTIRVPKGLPRPLPPDAVRLVVSTARTPTFRLALAFAAYAGLRCSEIAALSTDDLQFHTTPPKLTVRDGKGSKDREVPLHPQLVAMLGRRNLAVQGRIVPLRSDYLGKKAARHIRSCGFDRTIHDLRASFATELARVTHGDLKLIGYLLGHESMNTTAMYVGLSGARGVEAVQGMYGGDAA